MVMSVAITGAAGQLGQELVSLLPDAAALARADLDITDAAEVRRRLATLRPQVVINAAAFTRVDDCEDDPDLAFRVNAVAVRHLAQVCADLGALLVHISTDYVFDGAKGEPYTEDDTPNPLSVYGASKLAGEHFARALAPHLVIRTSGVYGAAGAVTRRGNFVETMLRAADAGRDLRVVADQTLSPTPARVVARKIVELVRCGRRGLYHVASAGQCSWYEFAREIFRLAGLSPRCEPVTAAAYGARARRPRYSVLARARLEAIGADDLPSWQHALAEYLRARRRLAADV
ncbi:MAG: dTDP-4-dehydrorhamnose reductase [Armatimonadota bacterium]|nr:dTDP-4-dehydrorhamnose reductase [Armatimonadota bacterium]